MDLGERLAFVRESAGLNQKQLAEKTGVARNTINRIEKNAQNPTVKILHALLDSCGSNLGDFFNVDQTDNGMEDLLWKVRTVIEKGGEPATIIRWAVRETEQKQLPAAKAKKGKLSK